MEMVARIQDLKHLEGMTYEEISNALALSSKTISKALLRPEEFVDGYRREKPAERPVLGKFVKRIEELLKGADWSRSHGRREVRRTARWVYRQLKKEGYAGAESTVRTYIRSRFKQPRPACPIEYAPAGEVQFDFGEYPVKIGDRVWIVHFVGAIFPYSTRRFLFAYPAERQECLFDAIEKTFKLSDGVPDRLTLDNTRLAVKKVLEGGKREETTAYARFRSVLGVNPRYTNRAAGWEKGHVEGTIGWAKRQVLLDLEVQDWQELDRVLLDACERDAEERRHGEEQKGVRELFEEERSLLRSIPYEGRRSYKTVKANVSPGGLIHVDSHRYSVPIELRGRGVRVRLFSDELVVTSEYKEVARHQRDWDGRGEHYKIEHYLGVLRRAPALLDHGKPFVRMPEWLKATREKLDDDKALIKLLLAVDSGQYTLGELQIACLAALGAGCVTRAVIEQRALESRHGERGAVMELSQEECGELAEHRFVIESPEMYNEILVSPNGKEAG
jgi:transposase